MAVVVLNGPRIAPGESLSGVMDCSAGKVVRLTMPPEWSTGELTFQISTDGIGFNDLVNADGEEIMVRVVPGAAVIFPADWARAVVFIKFRSGTRVDPAPQNGDRMFAIAIETP
jgi:hypothetical protein